MALALTFGSHAVGYPSKCLATEGGQHIYNVEITTAAGIDNGNLIGKSAAWKSFDLYEEAAATTFAGMIQGKAANGNWYVEVTNPGDALFVSTDPSAELGNYGAQSKVESVFYNAKGEVARAYGLAKGDILEVSDLAFDGTPVVGKTVSYSAKKMKVATT